MTNPTDPATDLDTKWFLENLVEKPPCSLLEIGAWDETTAYTLAEKGYNVTAIDIAHKYEGPKHQNLMPVQMDFIDYARMLSQVREGIFDVIVSTSTIEHFGLNSYGEHIMDFDYDTLAMQYIYKLLKAGGSAYITVPVGAKYCVFSYTPLPTTHFDWRVYNMQSIQDRIIQNFTVVKRDYFAAEAVSEFGWEFGKILTEQEAMRDRDGGPQVSIGLRLMK